MDAKLKAKWLRALRSGKYKQARKMLRKSTGGMCCIGVLAHVSDKSKWVKVDGVFSYGDHIHSQMLSGNELKRIGLDPELARELASANDKGKSFKTIAKIIEAKVE